jgi:hypothetical protein
VDVAGTSDLTVGGDLVIDGSYTGKDSTTINVTGTTTLDGTLDVTNALSLTGAGAITLTDTVTATGNATINGGTSVSLNGSLDVGGALDLDSVGNTTLTGTLDVAGTSDLTVGENLVITGDYTGGDNVTMTVTGTTDLTGTLAVTNDLLINGTGALTLANAVTVTRDATINGKASVSLNGSLDVNGALDLDSVGSTTLIGILDVAGTSDLTVGENLVITGDYTGGDNVTMTVAGTTDLTGTLAVTNNLLIDGTGSIRFSGLIKSSANLFLVSDSGIQLGGQLLAETGTVRLDAGQSIEMLSDTSAVVRADRLTASAGGDIGSAGQVIETEINVLSLSVASGDVFISNRSDSLTLLDTEILGQGSFQIQTSADLVIAGANLLSGGHNRFLSQGDLMLAVDAIVQVFDSRTSDTLGTIAIDARAVTFKEGSRMSATGNVTISTVGDIRITELSAISGTVSLASASGLLIGEAEPSGVNVVAKTLTVSAKGFALSDLESDRLAETVAGLQPAPLRVDVGSISSINGLEDLLNVVINSDGHLLDADSQSSVLHLITVDNQSDLTAIDPVELPLEQFETQRGLVFRDEVPGREGVSRDSLNEAQGVDELSWFNARLQSLASEMDAADEQADGETDEDMFESVMGPLAGWSAPLFGSKPGVPGYNLSASQGLSSVLGKVSGLQPRVTGDVADNPNLYDIFIDDYEMVF